MLSNRKSNAKVILPRKQGRKQNGPARRSSVMGLPHPPSLNGYEIRHSVTLRFLASTPGPFNITWQNLLDTIIMQTAGNVGSDMFYTVKVRRVKLWAVPIIGSSSSLSLAFQSSTTGVSGDFKYHTATSMGIEPAYLSAAPDKKSASSNFQTALSSEAFRFDCPSGTVIDCDLSFISNTDKVAVSTQNAATGGTTGTIMFRGLDGLAIASTALAPMAGQIPVV